MAACYANDVNDVTPPHVFDVVIALQQFLKHIPFVHHHFLKQTVISRPTVADLQSAVCIFMACSDLSIKPRRHFKGILNSS